LVRFLVEKYPTALSKADSNGSLPIHAAVSNAAVTSDVLDLLKLQYPKGLNAILPNGNALLHHGIEASCNLAEVVIKWLVQNWYVSASLFFFFPNVSCSGQACYPSEQ
jgi:hypothetical protein